MRSQWASPKWSRIGLHAATSMSQLPTIFQTFHFHRHSINLYPSSTRSTQVHIQVRISRPNLAIDAPSPQKPSSMPKPPSRPSHSLLDHINRPQCINPQLSVPATSPHLSFAPQENAHRSMSCTQATFSPPHTALSSMWLRVIVNSRLRFHTERQLRRWTAKSKVSGIPGVVFATSHGRA